jgi:hypothetical protein
MNKLISPISCNNYQVSHIKLEIFYGDLRIYFYVCIKIVFKIYYPYDKYVFKKILINHMFIFWTMEIVM